MSRRRSRAHGLRPGTPVDDAAAAEPKPSHKGSPRPEASDDLAVWGFVARSIERVALKGRAMRSTATPSAPVLSTQVTPRPLPPRPVNHRPSGTGPAPEPQHTPVRSKPSPDLSPFDRRKARRIATGRIEIDSRIDLHGMTEYRAHGALRHFIHSAHGQGCRTVLVITGKGGSPLDANRRRDDGSERGVLRRNVPRWLAEPDIAPLVVSFTTASTRHGGDGALYVHLRGRRG